VSYSYDEEKAEVNRGNGDGGDGDGGDDDGGDGGDDGDEGGDGDGGDGDGGDADKILSRNQRNCIVMLMSEKEVLHSIRAMCVTGLRCLEARRCVVYAV